MVEPSLGHNICRYVKIVVPGDHDHLDPGLFESVEPCLQLTVRLEVAVVAVDEIPPRATISTLPEMAVSTIRFQVCLTAVSGPAPRTPVELLPKWISDVTRIFRGIVFELYCLSIV
jgi:hypothetical protein